jgi:hypothetical protein
MKQTISVAALALMLAPVLFAKAQPSYDKGKLLSMDSVACGTQQNSSKSIASELIGTDDGHSKTQQLLCQEYTIQTDRLVYHVRPKDTKHPALLPVGEGVELRIQKDKMYLRAPESDDKEREYQVISIQMRDSSSVAKSGQ